MNVKKQQLNYHVNKFLLLTKLIHSRNGYLVTILPMPAFPYTRATGPNTSPFVLGDRYLQRKTTDSAAGTITDARSHHLRKEQAGGQKMTYSLQQAACRVFEAIICFWL